jgi:hypothetical protein
MFPYLHFKDIQHYRGYHIEVIVEVDYFGATSVQCRELNGRLPDKTYDRSQFNRFREVNKDEVVETVFEAFKQQTLLLRYVDDVTPKPIIRKPVDRKRISRSRKDRVFKLLKEIKNA